MRPSDDVIMRLLRYLEREFTMADGRADGEMIAEALTFGEYDTETWSFDEFERARARTFASEWDDDTWKMILAREQHLREGQGYPPRKSR